MSVSVYKMFHSQCLETGLCSVTTCSKQGKRQPAGDNLLGDVHAPAASPKPTTRTAVHPDSVLACRELQKVQVQSVGTESHQAHTNATVQSTPAKRMTRCQENGLLCCCLLVAIRTGIILCC